MANTSEDIGEVTIAPAGWRVAITAFDAADFQYGALIEHAWFWDALGIPQNQPQTSLAVAEKRQLQFLSSFQAFRQFLLEERNVALASVHGRGYRIILPCEQTEWAKREMQQGLNKALGKAQARMFNVDHSQLTADQLRENSDGLMHVGGLKALLLGRKRLTEEQIKQIGDESADR